MSIIQDTGVVIVLDWSRPHTMVSLMSKELPALSNHEISVPQMEELLRWLTWIETWSSDMTTKEEQEKGRQRREYRSPKFVVLSDRGYACSAIHYPALPRASQARRLYERRNRWCR